ncbi:LysR family transcriptional regulator [Actinomadura rudentiformis]|uniref:LysR family transcriptional regulator n=2 Tax=Actinomadura rudentiformis TaxID=359158 RepID=A0A6H9YXE1_9ACTN|nr:LysR family transcriptional regulator [Actinomadura rudentiformis]
MFSSDIRGRFRSMMDLQRLRLLNELRSRRTIAAVADALSYSPSTVSHQLSELQREVGVTLFERDGRRLRLTEAAHVLARHADVLLARVELAEAEVAATAGAVTGVVRIVAFQTAAFLLAPALADLAARHPGLRIETVMSEPDEALEALERRGCDLAICDEYEAVPRRRPAGFAFEELHVERVKLVVPRDHRVAGGTPVRIRDLESEVWAGGAPTESHGRLIIEVCRKHGGFTPDRRHQTCDVLALLALVSAGQAVTLLPELARPERDPAVAVLPIAGQPVVRRIFTAVREESLARPALAAVLAALREGRRAKLVR